jgi:ABC-type transport system involved in multi-copper enzyme maturation permease subunit
MARLFLESIRGELLLLRKRTAYWVILAVYASTAMLFSYVIPYLIYRDALGESEFSGLALILLLPSNLVRYGLVGFPFYGGIMVFIVGVLAIGSEFNWGTFTNTLVQRASRTHIMLAKFAALAIALVPFVLANYVLGAFFSSGIAMIEDVSINWPPLWDIARALGLSWYILALWAMFGAFLAVLFRGTSLAIGLGIFYALIVEGVISLFGRQLDLLLYISKGFLRTAGYSVVTSLGAVVDDNEHGPGAFEGPFIPSGRAAVIIAVYILIFGAYAVFAVRRRDVS